MGNGLVELSAARQNYAEIVVGLRDVGLDFNRFLEMSNGFVDLSAACQS